MKSPHKSSLPAAAVFFFLSSLAAFSITACSSSPTAQEAAASSDRENHERLAEDLRQEKEVGHEMATKLAGHFGLYEGAQRSREQSNDTFMRYLNLVGQTVAARSSRAEITYHFGILKDEEINAFATPGGYVFVTIGLLRTLQSESELAAVLGHEIAHVTQKHMYNQIAPKREVTAGETMTRVLSRGGSDVGLSVTKLVNQGMEILLEKGLGQEKEDEADEIGLTYAVAAGYDPSALRDYLTRLQSHSGTYSIAKTHPPFPERIQSLNAFMDANGMVPGQFKASKKLLAARFSSFQNQVPTYGEANKNETH